MSVSGPCLCKLLCLHPADLILQVQYIRGHGLVFSLTSRHYPQALLLYCHNYLPYLGTQYSMLICTLDAMQGGYVFYRRNRGSPRAKAEGRKQRCRAWSFYVPAYTFVRYCDFGNPWDLVVIRYDHIGRTARAPVHPPVASLFLFLFFISLSFFLFPLIRLWTLLGTLSNRFVKKYSHY